jgi:hypothetical protein
VDIRDKNHFPFTYNSYPNCSQQEETQKIYANMKDYDELIPLTTQISTAIKSSSMENNPEMSRLYIKYFPMLSFCP